MLKVKDLIEYLSDQNPDASICFFDSKLGDYRQMDGYLFKKVSTAKRDFETRMNGVFSEIESENERNEMVSKEVSSVFKYVKDDDILIGLRD